MTGFCEITYKDTAGELHTVDAWEEFGLVFEDGTYDALLLLPGMKDRYTNDWIGFGGQKIHAAESVKRRSRNLPLPLLILGKDKEDFWNKYNAVRRVLLGSKDYVKLDFKQIGYSVNLVYMSAGAATLIGSIKGIAPSPIDSDWILATGTWRNDGVWRDDGIWNFN